MRVPGITILDGPMAEDGVEVAAAVPRVGAGAGGAECPEGAVPGGAGEKSGDVRRRREQG